MTTPTDRPNLDRLRELDKAATPGPWVAMEDTNEVGGDDGWSLWDRTTLLAGTWYSENGLYGESGATLLSEADAALIAAYRNATPALVAALTDVLALHFDPGHDSGRLTFCAECEWTYPCPTIRAITDHLDLTNGAER